MLYVIFYPTCLVIAFFLTPLLRLPTSTVYPDILTVTSPSFTSALVKQNLAISVISFMSAIYNGLIDMVYGHDEGPGAELAMFQNQFAKHTKHDDYTGLIYPSEAYPMNNRRIFFITCMMVMPLCWVLSSVLLDRYLKMVGLEMEFRQELVQGKVSDNKM